MSIALQYPWFEDNTLYSRYHLKRDRTPESKEAKLIKVEGFKLDLRTPESCSSYEELLEYAALHGYKPGWAYYQARRRGMIA